MSIEGLFTEQPPPPDLGTHCPHCLARRITPEAGPCWLCHATLTAVEGPQPEKKKSFGKGFFLVILALLIGLIMLASLMESPGLGILVLIILGLTFSVTLLNKQDPSNHPMVSPWDWDFVVLGLGLVGLLLVATFIGFIVICTNILH